jgi:hypothetical protein
MYITLVLHVYYQIDNYKTTQFEQIFSSSLSSKFKTDLENKGKVFKKKKEKAKQVYATYRHHRH